MSMLSEAISSCVKTHAIYPQAANLNHRYQQAVGRFEEKKLLEQVAIDELSNYQYVKETYQIKLLIDNEYEKLKSKLENALF